MPGGPWSETFLEMMGVAETIAGTIEAYVSTAIRLTRDRPWRSAVRRRMSQYKHRVYRDNTAVEGLAEFLDRVARGQPWKEPR